MYVLNIFQEQQKGCKTGTEWRKDRLVENEVREVMGLGVVGKKYIVFVLRGHHKDSSLIIRLKWEATGGF